MPLNTTGKDKTRLDAQCIQAAMTYAQKYFLRGRFLLNTGDPDADADAPQEVAQPAPSQASKPPALIFDQPSGAIVLDDGQLLDSIESSRPLQTALYKFVHEAIVSSSNRETIIGRNMGNIVAIIPPTGRIALAALMQNNGVPAELISAMKADSPA